MVSKAEMQKHKEAAEKDGKLVEEPVTPDEVKPGEPTKAEKITARSNAKARLVEECPDRMNELLVEEFGKLGYDWSPEPTEEDRAEATIRELLEKHPQLRGRVLPASMESVAQIVEESTWIEPGSIDGGPAPEAAGPAVADDAEIPEGVDPWA